MTASDDIPTSPTSATRAPNLRRRTSSAASKKPWQTQAGAGTGAGASLRSSTSRNRRQQQHHPEEFESLSHQVSRASTAKSRRRTPTWWKIRLFKGMIDDVKRRAPFYWSDWKDAWDYRVVPATVYMYFANILPALAFSLDMFNATNNSYGVNEVLLASVLGCVVFSLLAAQPLVIVGVTGPITVFSYTVYDIVVPQGYNFFVFMAWIGIWSLIMHWILAITNSCNALTYVTRFSCDTFGFYVAFIYLQKGIQVLTRQWNPGEGEGAGGPDAAYLSIMVSLLVLGFAYTCGVIGESQMFQREVRKFIEDYGTPLTIIFFTGFVHIGHMKDVELSTLPTSQAFLPTFNRGWFVHFWDVGVGEVFLAIPFALLLTILFWFDHNVSSLIAQGTEFPLRKPPGFHWDIFLLGLTTGIAGLLGIPFPNGLIPQAPFHTQSLCVVKQVPINDIDTSDPQSPTRKEKDPRAETKRIVSHVVEQRVSNLAQGLLFVVTMTGPLLIVLHLIPQGVLAGLFFVMGVQALMGNGITLKLMYLARDRHLTSPDDPLSTIERRRAIWVFVGIELLVFAGTFAITQTIAAIGFPVIIILSIPFRTFIMPRWFRDSELKALDAPTAGAFVMESVGGAYGEESESTTPELTNRRSFVDTRRRSRFSSSATGGGSDHVAARNAVLRAGQDREIDEIAVVDDSMERGESYEMEDSPGGLKRSHLRSSVSASDAHGAIRRMRSHTSGHDSSSMASITRTRSSTSRGRGRAD